MKYEKIRTAETEQDKSYRILGLLYRLYNNNQDTLAKLYLNIPLEYLNGFNWQSKGKSK